MLSKLLITLACLSTFACAGKGIGRNDARSVGDGTPIDTIDAATPDTGPHDAATDRGIGDAATPDRGQPDAASDNGAIDATTDTNHPDAASDIGKPDTAGPDLAPDLALDLAAPDILPIDSAPPVDMPAGRNIFAGKITRSVYAPAGRRYSYAPSAVMDGSHIRIYTCENASPGLFRDSIHHVRYSPHSGLLDEQAYELGPGNSGSWDSVHVCDPAIVAGKFAFGGQSYNYAMFYLGTDRSDNTHNQVGVAFSKSLANGGAWVRHNAPLLTHPADGSWGVGQPSATSVDGNGRLLLFYTRGALGGTTARVRDINLANMGAPQIGAAKQLTVSGLTATTGTPDILNNFDVIYDTTRDRFFAIRPRRPMSASQPTFIAPRQQLVSIAGASVWNGGGVWRAEGEITPTLTGHPRNHNAGIVRTAHGTLPDPNVITVIYTTSCETSTSCTVPEWSYKLSSVSGFL
jgi:hypothetical protein